MSAEQKYKYESCYVSSLAVESWVTSHPSRVEVKWRVMAQFAGLSHKSPFHETYESQIKLRVPISQIKNQVTGQNAANLESGY